MFCRPAAAWSKLDAIQPSVSCEFYPLAVQGHSIWVIEVPEGESKPYVSSGSIYVRRGANSQKLRTPPPWRQDHKPGKYDFFVNAATHL